MSIHGKTSSIQQMEERNIRWFQKPYPLRHPRSQKERIEGRKSRGVFYKNSIYYYWFEFLRLSAKYRRACSLNGKGMSKLYNDFGDVYKIDFMNWWETKDNKGRDRGALLFGDSQLSRMENFVSLQELEELKPGIKNGGYKLVAIPTSATKREISRAFTFLLRDLEVSSTERESNAKYRICNPKITVNSLRDALKAWRYKNELGYTNIVIGAILSNKSKMEINRLKANMGRRSPNGQKLLDPDLANSYNVKAIRALRRAEANIQGVEQGIFPVSNLEELKLSARRG